VSIVPGTANTGLLCKLIVRQWNWVNLTASLSLGTNLLDLNSKRKNLGD
jgi:hypothetical protein